MRTPTGQHYIINCMGRKPEKGDVHVYVYVNHGAVHWKQTNKPCNIVSHLYTNTKYKLHKENADSIPLGPWWLGLLSHPQSLGRLGSQGWTDVGLMVWGGCASQWALPHGPAVLVSLCTGPQPPDPGGSSCSQTMAAAPKGWWSLWVGRALKSRLGSMSPGAGVPTSSLLP